MDRHTELTRRERVAFALERRGAAMATALFAIAVAAVLAAAVHWMARADIRTTANRESAVRAMAIAEAGLSHALSLVKDTLGDTTMTRLLRGWDAAKSTADDGYLTGYNLPSATQIPTTGRTIGGGTYFVRLTDDPAEKDGDPLTDRNTRVVATCRGVAADGSSATINAIIGNLSVPGIAVQTDVTMSGAVEVRGRCGNVHSNEDIVVSGDVIVEGNVSAVATASGSGSVENTYGEPLSPQPNAERVELPTLTAAGQCSRADYEILSNNTARVNATGAIVTLVSLGWTGSYPLFEATQLVVEGTYCVNGNFKMSQPVGSELQRKRVSFIVKGAAEISGNPWIQPDEAEGILLIADGDLKLSGNAIIGDPTANFQGFIYAGGHCSVSGKVTIIGQIICMNNPDGPAPTIDHVDITTFSGTVSINYPCRGFLSRLWRVVAWYPSPGA
jgi:cytoskeletal protein CcmA (bactofilin family)